MTVDDEDDDRPLSNGERRLAEYVDELISAALGRRAIADATDASVQDVVPDDAARHETGPTGTPETDLAEGVPGPAAPPSARSKTAARASMREGLASLFRDTAGHSTPRHLSADAPGVGVATGQSQYFKRFTSSAAQLPEPAPTGLPDLDDHLGDGFDFGLHLVCGEPGVGRTAFAEAVAWEALATSRPVLYYALREGSLGTWERLLGTLGAILGRPVPPLARLRSRSLSVEDLAALAEVDHQLQTQVLPRLTLLDSIPAYPDALGAFLEDVLVRTSQARDHVGRTPLVVVDDLQRLLLLTGCRTASAGLVRLTDGLAAESIPCLATSDLWALSQGGSTEAASVLVLTPVSTTPDGTYGRVDLQVRANARTGWTGTVPLVLDRRSGLFAQAGL